MSPAHAKGGWIPAVIALLLAFAPPGASAQQATAAASARWSVAASAGVWTRGYGPWRFGSIAAAWRAGDLVSFTAALTGARGETAPCLPSYVPACTRHFRHATAGVRLGLQGRVEPFSGIYLGWGRGWGGTDQGVAGVELGLRVRVWRRIGVTAQVARELLVDAEPEGGSRADGGIFVRF